MSEDMSPHSWRHLASSGSHHLASAATSRISSLKGYMANRESGSSWSLRSKAAPHAHDAPQEERQSWRAWAGQKIRVRKRGAAGPGNENTELVNVFPGWATRKYAANYHGAGPSPFELEVFISGYAISHRAAEKMTRPQRAFLRLAKGFASLPKIVDSAADILPNTSSLAHLTPSTEELLAQVNLPPRPTEITDDYDVDALERQLRLAKTSENQTGDDAASITSSSSSSRSSVDLPPSNNANQLGSNPRVDHTPNESNGATPAEVIKRLHANLEQRLQPFWSSVLANRTVRLHLFASPHQGQSPSTTSDYGNSEDSDSEFLLAAENGPIASQDVTTAVDGSFQVKFSVNWEDLCQHPKALHIAFGEAVEHELLIIAQLVPLPLPMPSRSLNMPLQADMPAPLTTLTRIPITHSPIRVVSDIDDTVKFSGILSGARAVFHNVFVKDLRDNVIPGMGEWYASMWSRGVRFHYVSNGPFELLPILNEFFEISQLPPGSIKLRSYAGRSLFNGLLSAPAARKRAGVVDVLDSFPESRFFLIGDTGEQDMELYADLARERPDRILGVFVRDADALTDEGPDPLEDPTGWRVLGAAGTRPDERPLVPRSESDPTAGSTESSSLSHSQHNFASNGSSLDLPPPYDINKTIRPNTHSLDSGLDDKARAKARDEAFFGIGNMSAEPESLDSGADASVTPTPVPSAWLGPSIVVNSPQTPTPNTTPSRNHRMPAICAKFVNQPPKPTPPPSLSGLNPGASSASFRSQNTGSSTSSSGAGASRKGSMTENEKKKQELQARVWRARTQMPSHIPLRVFREASECVEAQEILDRER